MLRDEITQKFTFQHSENTLKWRYNEYYFNGKFLIKFKLVKVELHCYPQAYYMEQLELVCVSHKMFWIISLSFSPASDILQSSNFFFKNPKFGMGCVTEQNNNEYRSNQRLQWPAQKRGRQIQFY